MMSSRSRALAAAVEHSEPLSQVMSCDETTSSSNIVYEDDFEPDGDSGDSLSVSVSTCTSTSSHHSDPSSSPSPIPGSHSSYPVASEPLAPLCPARAPGGPSLVVPKRSTSGRPQLRFDPLVSAALIRSSAEAEAAMVSGPTGRGFAFKMIGSRTKLVRSTLIEHGMEEVYDGSVCIAFAVHPRRSSFWPTAIDCFCACGLLFDGPGPNHLP